MDMYNRTGTRRDVVKRRLDKQRSTLNGKWTLIAIFVVLMIGAFLGAMNNQSKIADEPKKEVKAADEKKEVAEKEPEIKSTDLKNSTSETVESDLKLYDKNIDKVVVRNKALIVTYKDSAFWSDNSLMEEYAYDSINLIEDLYPNPNFDLFAFERPTIMTDDNGNENMETVFKSFYTRNTLDQMNLDNFTDMVLVDRERYFQKADGYWLHPGIFLNVDKKLREGIRTPINFDNMDEARYNMRDGAMNEAITQPDSMKKEEPIVAEPVTEEGNIDEEPDASIEQTDAERYPEAITSVFKISEAMNAIYVTADELQQRFTPYKKEDGFGQFEYISVNDLNDLYKFDATVSNEITVSTHFEAPDYTTGGFTQTMDSHRIIKKELDQLSVLLEVYSSEFRQDPEGTLAKAKGHFERIKAAAQTERPGFERFFESAGPEAN